LPGTAARIAVLCLLAGCATVDVHRVVAPGMASAEVAAAAGEPSAVGKLADGNAYWDYSRQPYYTDRVTFGPDERVVEVRNILTEQNFESLQAGMTLEQVVATVGPAYVYNKYANGTTVWTYRYQDVGIYKLLHVAMGPDGRMVRYDTEWNPDVYSKKGRGGGR
jgi:outer membrane protein assembly factor BamE (lipoprotein component of BamABCDE complex)